MDPLTAIVALATGYLIGSISFARIVGHFAAPGVDLTEETLIPSTDEERPLRLDAVSASTLGNRAGPAAGMTAGLLDVLKVLLPALAFRFLIAPGEPYYLLAAVGGMAGHIWPVYYRFHGGRGLSAAFASFLVVDPLGTLLAWVVGTALGLLVLRDGMVTFIGWMWLVIPWFWFRTGDWIYVVYALVINLLFIIAMIPEIRVYTRYRKEGIALSFEEGLQTTHMGRGLYKMGVRLRVLKEAPPKAS